MSLNRVIKKLNGKINNKKGSTILEAAMTIPIFVIVCCSLIMLINVIKTCNDIVFETSKEMRELTSSSIYSDSISRISALTIRESMEIEEKICDYNITNFKYAYYDNNIDNLMLISSRTDFKTIFSNIIGLKIRFDLDVKARAFTGIRLNDNGLDLSRFIEDGSSGFVVIFPRYGIRYHAENCRYVDRYKTYNEFMILIDIEEAKLRGYTPCEICHGGIRYE